MVTCGCFLCSSVLLSHLNLACVRKDSEILHLIKYYKRLEDVKVFTEAGKEKKNRIFVVGKNSPSAVLGGPRVLWFECPISAIKKITGAKRTKRNDPGPTIRIELVAFLVSEDQNSKKALLDFSQNIHAINQIRALLVDKITDDNFTKNNIFQKSFDYFSENIYCPAAVKNNPPPLLPEKLVEIPLPKPEERRQGILTVSRTPNYQVDDDSIWDFRNYVLAVIPRDQLGLTQSLDDYIFSDLLEDSPADSCFLNVSVPFDA